MDLPSGANLGAKSHAGCVVSRSAFPPDTAAVQISPFQENSTLDPSGERDGNEAIRIGWEAFTAKVEMDSKRAVSSRVRNVMIK